MSPAHLPQESDRVPALPAVALIVSVLGVIAVGLWWPWHILRERAVTNPQWELGAPPGKIPPPDLREGLRQTLIEEEAREQALAPSPAPEPLEGFAWVDREEGTVRIPIEDAMEVWVARHAEGTSYEDVAELPGELDEALESPLGEPIEPGEVPGADTDPGGGER